MEPYDRLDSWSQKCACGKAFYKPNSFSNHIRSCARYKNDVGSVLDGAKARYAQRQKSRKGKAAIESWYGGEGQSDDLQEPEGGGSGVTDDNVSTSPCSYEK